MLYSRVYIIEHIVFYNSIHRVDRAQGCVYQSDTK